jgi:hypothetical protein
MAVARCPATPFAWGSPELGVLAFVAVRRPARRPQIVLGAAAPLRRALVIAKPDEHGSDGLGDAVDWPPVTGRRCSAAGLVALARANAED